MTVLEFVDRLAERMDVSRDKAYELYKAFVATLRVSLASGEEVRFEHLGKLNSRRVSASQGRPALESNNAPNQIQVEFFQYRSSLSGLMSECPFIEEIEDD